MSLYRNVSVEKNAYAHHVRYTPKYYVASLLQIRLKHLCCYETLFECLIFMHMQKMNFVEYFGLFVLILDPHFGLFVLILDPHFGFVELVVNCLVLLDPYQFYLNNRPELRDYTMRI